MSEIIEIVEELLIPGTDIILEKGDRIKLVTEGREEEYMYMDFDDIIPELQDRFAKIISSEWYDGMNDPLYALTSTGSIIKGIRASIMNNVGEERARTFLMDYVDDRGFRKGEPGWQRIRW